MKRLMGSHVRKVSASALPLAGDVEPRAACCRCDTLSFVLRTAALLVALGAAAFAAARVRQVTQEQPGAQCPLTLDLAS